MTKDTFCKVTTTHYELKEGTKTVYQEVDQDQSNFTEEQYNNCVEAGPFMKRLGGSEHNEKSYTSKGNIVTRITSKSPDREKKTVRVFDFD